eukprot:jgi/Chlat1/8285/Chrsp78S09211
MTLKAPASEEGAPLLLHLRQMMWMKGWRRPSSRYCASVNPRAPADLQRSRNVTPEHAARAVDPAGWRDLMDATREAARRLARRGLIAITQRGETRDPDAPFKGPIRLRIKVSAAASDDVGATSVGEGADVYEAGT